MKMLYGCPFEKNEKEVFFRLTTFFLVQKNFVQGTTFVQFFMYYYAKKNFGAIQKKFFWIAPKFFFAFQYIKN